MVKKKALFLHGFLGNYEDMHPFFVEGHDCYSVNLKDYMKDKSKILKDFKGPFDIAFGYSYGGRVLGKLLDLKLDYVAKPVFVSARLSSYSNKELEERTKLKDKLLNMSIEEFYNFWSQLPLFGKHSMKDHRSSKGTTEHPWSLEEIHYYLNYEFTFENQIDLNKLKNKALYFYGESDLKYGKEAQKMPFKSKSFQGGHRFLFDQIEAIKSEIKNL